MFNRTMAAYWLPTASSLHLKSRIRYRPALFLVSVSLLLGTGAMAEQVSRQRAESCPTNQLIDAREAWGKFTSNDEATEFARRKFLALGAEEFIKWLSCQSFDVHAGPWRGETKYINATFIPSRKDEGLWVPSGFWVMQPWSHYIEVHTEEDGAIDRHCRHRC